MLHILAWFLASVVAAMVATVQRFQMRPVLPFPDEAGLSPDSLRGSEQHIRPDLIGSDAKNPYTGGSVGRAPLSYNEAHALAALNVDLTDVEMQTNPDDLPGIIRGPDSAPPVTVPPQIAPSPLPAVPVPGTPASPTVPPGTAPLGTPMGPDGTPVTPDKAGAVGRPVDANNDSVVDTANEPSASYVPPPSDTRPTGEPSGAPDVTPTGQHQPTLPRETD